MKRKIIDEQDFSSYVEKYYLLLSSIDDAIILVDINNELVVEYNKSAALLLNIKSSCGSIYHYQFYDPVNKIKYLNFYKNCLKNFKNQIKELYINVNEISIPVKIKISISYINNLKIAQVVFTDLRYKHRLEARRDLLASAIDQVAESVIITNSQWNVEYVNSSYEKKSGFSCDQIYKKKFNVFENLRDNSYIELIMEEISNGNIWKGNLINKDREGNSCCENTTITPITNKNGEVINYITVKRDVTQDIIFENQIRQSQKIQAIGMLAGGIAHDFNNILTSILGFAELCKIQCNENSIIYSNIEEIIQASTRAGKLIDQILKFSMDKNKEISKFNISEILKEVIKLIKATVKTGVEISYEIVSESKVRGDQNQIHQVLMNLCTNAVQSIINDNGFVEIKLFNIILLPQEAVTIGRLTPGKYVCFQIKDNGVGINKEYMQRIFEPYFTTKKLNEGTGLGLSVVHGIVNDHRGAITVESEAGVGSCFTVYLPAADDEIIVGN